MPKIPILIGLGALVGLVWYSRRSSSETAATKPLATTLQTAASTAATGNNPLVIIARPSETSMQAAADAAVSNPVQPVGPVASFGAGTSAASTQATAAADAEADAAFAAYRSGAPAPAGWRYTPAGPVRI